jgi:hypothetical protein
MTNLRICLLCSSVLAQNSIVLGNGSLKERFVGTNTLVEIKALPRDWNTVRSNKCTDFNRQHFQGDVLSSVRSEL